MYNIWYNEMLDVEDMDKVKHYRPFNRVRNWAHFRCERIAHTAEDDYFRRKMIVRIDANVDFIFTVDEKYVYCTDPHELMILKLKGFYIDESSE